MFQEDYEEYLQDPQNFSHLDVVPNLLMEAMQKVRDGMHEMKELTMLKSEIDEKSKTRKKITVFVLVVVVLCIVWKALK